MTITGKELKEERRKTKMNQTEFGRSIGLSRHCISYWETKKIIHTHAYMEHL